MRYILQDIPLGKNIQKIRQNKNLTQEELAAKLQLCGSKMSRSTLGNIESGKRNIKASDLVLLTEILEVDYKEFFKVDYKNEL